MKILKNLFVRSQKLAASSQLGFANLLPLIIIAITSLTTTSTVLVANNLLTHGTLFSNTTSTTQQIVEDRTCASNYDPLRGNNSLGFCNSSAKLCLQGKCYNYTDGNVPNSQPCNNDNNCSSKICIGNICKESRENPNAKPACEGSLYSCNQSSCLTNSGWVATYDKTCSNNSDSTKRNNPCCYYSRGDDPPQNGGTIKDGKTCDPKKPEECESGICSNYYLVCMPLPVGVCTVSPTTPDVPPNSVATFTVATYANNGRILSNVSGTVRLGAGSSGSVITPTFTTVDGKAEIRARTGPPGQLSLDVSCGAINTSGVIRVSGTGGGSLNDGDMCDATKPEQCKGGACVPNPTQKKHICATKPLTDGADCDTGHQSDCKSGICKIEGSKTVCAATPKTKTTKRITISGKITNIPSSAKSVRLVFFHSNDDGRSGSNTYGTEGKATYIFTTDRDSSVNDVVSIHAYSSEDVATTTQPKELTRSETKELKIGVANTYTLDFALGSGTGNGAPAQPAPASGGLKVNFNLNSNTASSQNSSTSRIASTNAVIDSFNASVNINLGKMGLNKSGPISLSKERSLEISKEEIEKERKNKCDTKSISECLGNSNANITFSLSGFTGTGLDTGGNQVKITYPGGEPITCRTNSCDNKQITIPNAAGILSSGSISIGVSAQYSGDIVNEICGSKGGVSKAKNDNGYLYDVCLAKKPTTETEAKTGKFDGNEASKTKDKGNPYCGGNSYSIYKCLNGDEIAAVESTPDACNKLPWCPAEGQANPADPCSAGSNRPDLCACTYNSSKLQSECKSGSVCSIYKDASPRYACCPSGQQYCPSTGKCIGTFVSCASGPEVTKPVPTNTVINQCLDDGKHICSDKCDGEYSSDPTGDSACRGDNSAKPLCCVKNQAGPADGYAGKVCPKNPNGGPNDYNATQCQIDNIHIDDYYCAQDFVKPNENPWRCCPFRSKWCSAKQTCVQSKEQCDTPDPTPTRKPGDPTPEPVYQCVTKDGRCFSETSGPNGATRCCTKQDYPNLPADLECRNNFSCQYKTSSSEPPAAAPPTVIAIPDALKVGNDCPAGKVAEDYLGGTYCLGGKQVEMYCGPNSKIVSRETGATCTIASSTSSSSIASDENSCNTNSDCVKGKLGNACVYYGAGKTGVCQSL